MKWGYNDTTLVVGLSLKYLSCDKSLMNLVQCSKEFNEIFKKSCCKQCLLYSQNMMTPAKRDFLWGYFFDSKANLLMFSY